MSRFAFPRTMRMTEREYRANLEGLNILFGAVLGFVLAGAESLSTDGFVAVLIATVGVVVTILYLSSSAYTLFYAALAIGSIIGLPWVLEQLIEMPPPPKLQPTLAVWAGLVIALEVLPRERGAGGDGDGGGDG